ncbi:hypothetical protein FUAX_51530 (plasmid) [Fulvitalea axinellae]|uniref:Cyclic nucleotide-binding domain-containing protein n=1 Tax=Fulvitalea axinellae TaxID=1182444 RepID=A0AAU9CUK7_9BACT|nr:hypothetical protein FUAX_51530 [Fulvitalea axinellae]
MSVGDRCTKNHFVLEGCLQMYFLTEKGDRRTTHFAIENCWMTDLLA